MTLLITAIVCGILYLGGMFLLSRMLKVRSGKSAGKDIEAIDDKIRLVDGAVTTTLPYIKEMVPLEDAQKKDQEIASFERQLAEEREKLGKLDKQVQGLQSTIEEEEGKHNELKKGKDVATELARDVRTNQDRLKAEFEHLENELSLSLAQVTALSGEITLTNEQQVGLQKIQNTLQLAQDHMNMLGDIYTQASTRFLNLENQYCELEKEFTKLVERELSGKM